MNLWEEWVCVRQHARKRTTVIAILLLAVSLSSFAHVTAHSPDSLTLWATPNDPGSKKAWQLPSNLRKVEEFLTATDAALAALATGDQGYWYDLFSNAVIDPYMDNVPQALAAIVYMRWILGVHVVMPGFRCRYRSKTTRILINQVPTGIYGRTAEKPLVHYAS